MSKSNSSEESTESDIELKPKVDINSEEWEIGDKADFMYYSTTNKGKFYCSKCDVLLNSPNGSSAHLKNVHPELNQESIEESTEENGDVDRTKSAKLRKELFGPGIKYDTIKDTGDLALQINIEEESKLVSQLIKNPYVTFTFAKLKDERKIYPDWSLADFLREGALYLCKKLGCEIGFEFDIELLKQDKEFSEIAVKINEAWEEHDAEIALERAGGTKN